MPTSLAVASTVALLICGVCSLIEEFVISATAASLCVFQRLGSELMPPLNYNLSVAVWVGLIALLGVDAETGMFMLLYLDLTYQERREKGLMQSWEDLKQAVIAGAVQRLRPKVMTGGGDVPGAGANHVEPRDWRGRDETHRRANDRWDFHFVRAGVGGLPRDFCLVEMASGGEGEHGENIAVRVTR